MAFIPYKTFRYSGLAGLFCSAALMMAGFVSCRKGSKTYQSNCNNGLQYRKVSFTELINHTEKYNHQYVEVQGTYKEGINESALVNDSLFTDHSSRHALWVNFSQDCPLYLKGTHIGLFEYANGKFTQINNQTIIIRGKIDVLHRGHLGSYRGTIDRVSYVKLYSRGSIAL